MALHTETTTPPSGGRGDATPLVLTHGFTQNIGCWGRFGAELARHHPTVLVDGPGHGRSGHDDADLWAAADLTVEAAGPGVIVGYSMGGRVALHAALAHPEQVEGLVLIGATAGLDDGEERSRRRAADEALADRLLAEGLEAFLDRWLAGPLFADLPTEAAALEARLRNRPEGLAASLRNCGTGTQEPLWTRLGELTMPVTIIVGDRDTKFTATGHRMVEAMTATTAELVSISGNHAVHLERPQETAAAVRSALAAR